MHRTPPIAVVGAAIIRDDGAVLCARRGHGALAGFWEFPGGKVEPGETAQQALVREIDEELHCTVTVGAVLSRSAHDGERPIELTVYRCTLTAGQPRRTEHSEITWLHPDRLHELDWAPADLPAAQALAAQQHATQR